MMGEARVRRARRSAWTILVTVMSVAGLLLAPAPASAGEDVCPEPNDHFQQSCYLGGESDALGFLQAPEDVDFYRIESLDFGARVQVELRDLALAYRVYLADWKGDLIAESEGDLANQRIDRTLGPPGTYYLLVDARVRVTSPDVPYRIVTRLTYPSGAPNVLYSTEFRRPEDTDAFTGSNEAGTYRAEQNRYFIDVRKRGTPDAIEAAWSWWGPVYTDFTFVADVRMTTPGQRGGYFFSFQRVDDDNLYQLLVNAVTQELAVLRRFDGEQKIMVPWTSAPAINPDDGINRVVVRSVGGDRRININGNEVAHFRDDTLRSGQIGLGALSFGGLVTVVYDNIIVTSPG